MTVFGDIVITKLVEDIQIDWSIRDIKIERVRTDLMKKKLFHMLYEPCGLSANTSALNPKLISLF